LQCPRKRSTDYNNKNISADKEFYNTLNTSALKKHSTATVKDTEIVNYLQEGMGEFPVTMQETC